MSAGSVIYAQCGLRIRSEIELHLPVAHGDGWDVDVAWGPDMPNASALPPGEIIASSGSGEDNWYTATSTESGFRLRFRDCGEFVISRDLARVQVRRAPTEHAKLLPILLAGTVSAFLLTLRGKTVMHASAVALDGTALAFVGQSGRGKSTLAAVMCLDGATLVTDDVLTLDAGPPATCLGGASELRLRDAAAVLADARPDAPSRHTEDDRVALALETAPPTPLPLVAVVVPRPSRTASQVEVQCVPSSTALFWLLSFPRIHGWCLPEVLSRDFTTLSQLVNSVPVYDVTVPWGPPFDPSVARSLRALGDAELATSRGPESAEAPHESLRADPPR